MRVPRIPGGPLEHFCLAVVVLFVLLIVIAHLPTCTGYAAAEAAKAEPKNELIKGYDYGKGFLKPKTKKGKKYRKAIWKIVQRFKAFFWKWMRDEMIPGASRARLESRANWWSHTKDQTIYEAGMMSNGYYFTRWVCLEYGICGDPCGDPAFSIFLAGFRRYVARQRMLYEPLTEEGKENFWHPWLLEQCEQNRFECEAIIGMCGAINCQKLRMAMIYAGTDSVEGATGKKGVMHAWWKTANYLRAQPQDKVLTIFAPKTELWKIGSRLGRVVAQIFMRAEFYVPGEPSYRCLDAGYDPDENVECMHEEEIPQPFYGWSETEFAYFPFRWEVREIEGVSVAVLVPDAPEPLYPTGPNFMPFSEWRKRCVLYATKAWYKATGEIRKCNEKYKKTACVDGVCWKKGQKKYPDCAAAKAEWEQEMRDTGVFPTLEMQAQADKEMAVAGYVLRLPVVLE